MSVYLTPYKLGDYVDIKVNAAVHKVRRIWPCFAALRVRRAVVARVGDGYGCCTRGVSCCALVGCVGGACRIQPSKSNRTPQAPSAVLLASCGSQTSYSTSV